MPPKYFVFYSGIVYSIPLKLYKGKRMTYKLNPALSKILSPIILILPDGNKQEYENGNELVEAVFDKCYMVKSMKAVSNSIEITLMERTASVMNWNGEEAVSFF